MDPKSWLLTPVLVFLAFTTICAAHGQQTKTAPPPTAYSAVSRDADSTTFLLKSVS
jgi:hypothetical protein